MGLVLLFSDMLGLLIASGLALFLWSFVRSDLIPASYVALIPLIFIFALVYEVSGLYPAIGLNPVEELRLLSISTTVVFLWLGTMAFYFHNFERFSRASFGLAWIFALIILPVNRSIIRSIFSAFGFWGEPIALIGNGERGQQIMKYLEDHPKMGYRPVVIINGFSNGFSSVNVPSVQVYQYPNGGMVSPYNLRDLDGVKTALLVTSEIPEEFLMEVIEGRWFKFPHLILVADNQKSGSIWIEPHDIGGVFGLEVRQNLFSDVQQAIKRVVELGIVLVSSPLLLVSFAILAALIRLNSPGPVFYRQTRIGKNGKEFTIWKFRTMLVDADLALMTYLEKHPDLQSEWQKNQKIKNDPRVTQVGKMLRRLSLDELPQIFNVLRGEMSLVGPRPIVAEEIGNYGNRYHLYTKVKPGLTGLWQVSGRNDTTYEQRVRFDEYYVRNWSVWMDIYIIAQTFQAVLVGKGAY
jgi:Undecaprenyl-phosphate galactose phosphotransferase WbaP